MRIVIVEDHLMFREVLKKVCAVDLKHQVVGEAEDGRRAVEVVAKTTPDLVLLDLHLPNLNGFGVLEEIRAVSPESRVLVLSSHCDEYTVFQADKLRVQGFVDKNTNSVESLKEAIGAVAAGRAWFSPAFQRIKTARLRDPQSFDKLLTEREREILVLVGAPCTDAQIAERLKVAPETVEKHRYNIQRKLNLHSAPELVRYAREHGFTLSTSAGRDGALLP